MSIVLNSGVSSSMAPIDEVVQKLKTLKQGWIFRPDTTLVRQLKEMQASDLKTVLTQCFSEMIQEGTMTDSPAFLSRLAEVVPLEKLEGNAGDILREAQGMFQEAKLYLELTQEKISPTLKSYALGLLNGILAALESLINAFGIGDFFKPAENEIQASMKSQKIMTLLSLFSMLTSMALSLIGLATGGLIIGGVLLGISALSLLWPYIKPLPTHLPMQSENWTKEVRKGGVIAPGRKESLDQIAAIMKRNRHSILVGPSRVGKSLTAKAFAQAVERGDYPELQGKVVFCLNTADLTGKTTTWMGDGNVLNRISAAMGRHRKDVILVLDEIHMACKNNEKIGEQLKTFLDEGGEFPHVIGITTEEEYDAHVRPNFAFSRRFDKVVISNTGEAETLKVLSDKLLGSKAKPLVEPGALLHLYHKSQEDGPVIQPTTALTLLEKCIQQTTPTQRSSADQRIAALATQILSLRSQAATLRGSHPPLSDEVDELETEMATLRQAALNEKNQLKQLFKTKKVFDRVAKATYSSAIKLSQEASEKETKQFVLLHEFLSPLLEAHIKRKATELNAQFVITPDLIDEQSAIA
ncbi:MAG: AAA family ATPase [Simkaniaceae bacterium]|nr:AAA family ATPase [Simkaniaceae bacterium]